MTLSNNSFSISSASQTSGVIGNASWFYPWNLSYSYSLVDGDASGEAENHAALAGSIAGSPVVIDLTSINSPAGVFSFTNIKNIIIVNNSQTAGENIVVGGGSDPYDLPFDEVTIPPGGVLAMASPLGGFGAVDSSHKNLRLSASTYDASAGTPTYSIYLVGLV